MCIAFIANIVFIPFLFKTGVKRTVGVALQSGAPAQRASVIKKALAIC